MVAIDGHDDPKATREFEADVVILHHSTTVAPGYQPVIHCGVVRQAAAILSMSGTESGMEALRTGQTATVRFRFMVRAAALTLSEASCVCRKGMVVGHCIKLYLTYHACICAHMTQIVCLAAASAVPV